MAKSYSTRRELSVRFWEKVCKGGPEECWEWTAALQAIGKYGAFRVGGRKGRTVPAHRVAWELTNGAIPAGLFVCHRCDNPKCVNPRHLFLGTCFDNMTDARCKGRIASHGVPMGTRGRTARNPNSPFGHRGVKNCKAKLTPDDVRAIRQRYAAGGITQKELGRQYGIGQVSINHIILRNNWQDVE